MTANDPSRQQEAVNECDAELAILPNFPLDASNDRPTCASGGVVVQKPPVRTSAQIIPVAVAGFAVLLFTSGLAFNSRNLSCQLLETLGDRHTFPTRRHIWRRASGCRLLTRTPSRRTLGVWRLCARRDSVPFPADDHCICDSFRSCDPTNP